MFLPVLASQSRTVSSKLPLAIVFASGENATLKTQTRMPSERAYVSAGVSIPEPDCVVVTSTCDSVSMRRKRHASDISRMPGEGAYVSAGVGIPEDGLCRPNYHLR